MQFLRNNSILARKRTLCLTFLLIITCTITAYSQSNTYFEAAAQYRAAASASKCPNRKQYLSALAEYTECIGNTLRSGKTCTLKEPKAVNIDCPADSDSDYIAPDINKTTEHQYSTLGRLTGSTLNPFLQELYKSYNGMYAHEKQVANVDWMGMTGVQPTTMAAVSSSAAQLYQSLGKFDSDAASRLAITSSIANLISVGAQHDYRQTETLQAAAMGIGLLWDIVEKSKIKRLKVVQQEKNLRELEQAQAKYKRDLMQAKSEFITGFSRKIFEKKYSGNTRKAIALWYPKNLTIEIQPIIISNLIDIKSYDDGSFPLLENLYAILDKQAPDTLRANLSYNCSIVYPIVDQSDYDKKLVAILKATENVHFTPFAILIRQNEEKAQKTDFWDNPTKQPKTNKLDSKSFWNE